MFEKKDIEAILALYQAFKRARWLELDGEEILSLNGALAQILLIKRNIEQYMQEQAQEQQKPIVSTPVPIMQKKAKK